MKKNWTMRVALLVVALTLITSCFVGGTFAKYVTGGSYEDTARVAKFGVTVEADGALFASQYETDDANADLEGKYSVEVGKDSEDKLVAPGTKGEAAAITLSGVPEVAVRISYKATIALEGWEIPVLPVDEQEAEASEAEQEYAAKDGEAAEPATKTEEYCPIWITVNDETYYIKYAETEGDNSQPDATVKAGETTMVICDDIADLIEHVEDAIEGLTKDYDPNTDLSLLTDDAVAISWEWPFSTSEENDVRDTALGDIAAEDVTKAATIKLGLAVTVTQID